jgi:hypothetical protein
MPITASGKRQSHARLHGSTESSSFLQGAESLRHLSLQPKPRDTGILPALAVALRGCTWDLFAFLRYSGG